MRVSSLFFFSILFTTTGLAWGPTGHQWVTHRAIDSLVGRFGVLQGRHRVALVGRTMAADYRKDKDPEEAPHHFVDMERYGRDLFTDPEIDLDRLVLQFGRQVIRENGTGPWSASKAFDRLVEAFLQGDFGSILLYSSDLSHYLADLHQPLHTTENFNGQLTGQLGIHARFETELLNRYVSQIPLNRVDLADLGPVLPALFDLVLESHQEVDTILRADHRIVSELDLDRNAFRRRGERRNYPDPYFERMFEEVGELLEERLNQAAHRVASFWWMAWKRAGEPDF